METVIERALNEYGKCGITDDAALGRALMSLIDEESRKGAGDRDQDLIDEAIEFFLGFAGADADLMDESALRIAQSALDEYPEASAGTGRRLKWIVPVAALTALLLAAAVAAGVIEIPKFDITDDIAEDISTMEPGETATYDGWEISLGDRKEGEYALEDVPDVMGRSVLLPVSLGEEYTVRVEGIDDFGEYKVASITVDGADGRNEMEIKNTKSPSDGSAKVNIFGYEAEYFRYSDASSPTGMTYQASFDAAGCNYCVWAVTERDLERIIESLEEIGK